MDNDGWLDILMSNGHVYPEVDKSNADLKYAEHKYLYRNLQNGRFEEVTEKGGPGIMENAPARGCAFGDYDNDGDLDIIVNCVNAIPQLLRCDSTLKRSWIKVKLVGVKSNRTALGARVTVHYGTKMQAQEVLSQASFYSVNDTRLHFGLGAVALVDIDIRWPNGGKEKIAKVAANQLITVKEGAGIVKRERFGGKQEPGKK
jgi:hypothetical protein